MVVRRFFNSWHRPACVSRVMWQQRFFCVVSTPADNQAIRRPPLGTLPGVVWLGHVTTTMMCCALDAVKCVPLNGSRISSVMSMKTTKKMVAEIFAFLDSNHFHNWSRAPPPVLLSVDDPNHEWEKRNLFCQRDTASN